MKIGQVLKMGHFFQKNGANFENGAKIKNLKCASYAREMRVKCALSARESCAKIRALFTNDTRQMRVDTRDLPGAFSWGNNLD